MNNLTGHKFYVALHVLDLPQTIEMARKILTPEGGADGVFIVNNGGYIESGDEFSPNLFDIAIEIKKLHPNHMVGINPLDLPTRDAILKMPSGLDALWSDIGGIKENDHSAFLDPELVPLLKNFKVPYYGSALFKVGVEAKNPKLVAQAAAHYFTAMVTSGKGTGLAPDIEKLESIRSWIGPKATLVNASGTTAENVGLFMPYVNEFIVGTSLCRGNGRGENQFYYEEEKVLAFRKAMNAYDSK